MQLIVASVFVICAIAAIYPYVLYPWLLWFLCRKIKPHPPTTASNLPSFTVIIPCHDEEVVIKWKIENTLDCVSHTPGHSKIIVVSDGSTDKTCDIAKKFVPRIRLIELPTQSGILGAFRAAMREITSEVVIFSDADIIVSRETFNCLLSHYSLIVADWHYIDSEFMHRFASNCNNPAKKLYAFRTADLLRTAERNFANSCAMNIAVCERERGILASIAPHVPAYVVPNGIECSYYSPEELARAFNKNDQVKGTERKLERNRLLFVGSMDYQANIDAVVWFGDRVWPELSHRLPQLLFTVVGRDPSTAVIKLAAIPRIEVTGWVADVRGFYHDALAAVVPLHFGSGTRIKILEAMAANVPVVSTSAGAEGLDVLPDVHYLAAETPEDFRLAIENLHSDSPLRKRLTMNARRLVEKRYDWKLIGSRLRSIYCGALNLHAQSTA